MWRAGAFRVILLELASVFSPTAVPPLACTQFCQLLNLRGGASLPADRLMRKLGRRPRFPVCQPSLVIDCVEGRLQLALQ